MHILQHTKRPTSVTCSSTLSSMLLGLKLSQHTQHSTMPAATHCNWMVKLTTNEF